MKPVRNKRLTDICDSIFKVNSSLGQVSRKRNFSWNLLFGYANLLLAMSLGLFMVPIYLEYIPSATYGAWLASGNILVWLVAINPGIATVIQQQVASLLGEGKLGDVSETIGFGLFITFIISLVATCLGVMFADNAIAMLRLSDDTDSVAIKKAFIVAAVSTGLILFSDGLVSILHALHSSFFVGLVNVLGYLLAIMGTIILLRMGFGILALPYGAIIRGGSIVLLNLFFLPIRLRNEGIKIRFTLARGKTILNLFSYSFLGRIGGILTGNMESVIIARYFGSDAVVPIVLTKRIPAVFETVILMIARALCPSLAHLKGQGNDIDIQTILSRVSVLVFWMSGFVLSFVLVFNDEIMNLWVGKQVFAGRFLNVTICCAVFISIISHFFLEVSAALGEIKKSAMATFIQSILFVPIVWVSVEFFGLAGVVIGPATAMILVSGWYYLFLVCRTAKFNVSQVRNIAKEIVITAVVSLVMLFAFYQVQARSVLQLIMHTSIFSLGYFVALIVLSGSFRHELLTKILPFARLTILRLKN